MKKVLTFFTKYIIDSHFIRLFNSEESGKFEGGEW